MSIGDGELGEGGVVLWRMTRGRVSKVKATSILFETTGKIYEKENEWPCKNWVNVYLNLCHLTTSPPCEALLARSSGIDSAFSTLVFQTEMLPEFRISVASTGSSTVHCELLSEWTWMYLLVRTVSREDSRFRCSHAFAVLLRIAATP